MDSGKLTIRVTGDDEAVSLASFLKVAQTMFELLRGVDETVSGEEGNRIEWQIESVSMDSPLAMTIGSKGGYTQRADTVIHGVLSDVASLDERSLQPRYLRETLMEKIKGMVSVLSAGLTRIELEAAQLLAVPTQRIAAHVDELTQPYEADATLEGTLEMVNLHETKIFRIYDTLTGSGVECVFTDEQRAEVKGAIETRVSVHGTMKYHRDGRPIKMKARSITRLTGSPPQFFEVPPIDVTGGVDPGDYVEGLHEDE